MGVQWFWLRSREEIDFLAAARSIKRGIYKIRPKDVFMRKRPMMDHGIVRAKEFSICTQPGWLSAMFSQFAITTLDRKHLSLFKGLSERMGKGEIVRFHSLRKIFQRRRKSSIFG